MILAFNCYAIFPYVRVSADKDGYIEVLSNIKSISRFEIILESLLKKQNEINEGKNTIFTVKSFYHESLALFS